MTILPLRNQYSALASTSHSYSQAVTQKRSPPSLANQTKSVESNPQTRTKPSPLSLYFCKPSTLAIKLLETDEMDAEQNLKIPRIFPSSNGKITQYHLPSGYQEPPKPQEFYEFILVDTDSVEITHIPEKESEEIAYSKCKIKRFLTKEEWGNPFKPRMFSQNYLPQQYNYHDYQEAWYNAFYLKPTNHSWFLSFSPKFDNKIPSWTHQWWIYFGLTRDILPEPIQRGWDYFHERLKTASYGNKSIMFTIEFQIPWIVGWDLIITRSLDQQFPPMLERRFRIKWWRNFQPNDRVSTNNIDLWFITKDRPRQFPKPTPPTNHTPTRKELKKKLLEELSQLGSSDEETDSTQPKDSEQDPRYMKMAQDPYEDYDLL